MKHDVNEWLCELGWDENDELEQQSPILCNLESDQMGVEY
jgi:hypothetical protein